MDVKIGMQACIQKRLLFDLSIGFGSKVMFTKQRGRTNPDDSYASNDVTVGSQETALGTAGSFAMPMQLSFAYILK